MNDSTSLVTVSTLPSIAMISIRFIIIVTIGLTFIVIVIATVLRLILFLFFKLHVALRLLMFHLFILQLNIGSYFNLLCLLTDNFISQKSQVYSVVFVHQFLAYADRFLDCFSNCMDFYYSKFIKFFYSIVESNCKIVVLSYC